MEISKKQSLLKFLYKILSVIIFIVISFNSAYCESVEYKIRKTLTEYILSETENPPASVFDESGFWKMHINKIKNEKNNLFVEGFIGFITSSGTDDLKQFGGFSEFLAVFSIDKNGEFKIISFKEGVSKRLY